MEKVPCLQCGVCILPITAEKNGGLCMPCTTGIRANLEKSRQYYKAQRELDKTDPVRIHWRSLLDRLRADNGYSGLSIAEKRYFAVTALSGEVHNGGFGQYFYNTASDHYQDAVEGLEEIGALASLDLLLRAKQVLFGFGEVPVLTSRRRLTSARTSDSKASRLDKLDRLFWTDPDGLSSRLEALLLRHGLVSHVA
ncbi:DUF4375 domain-containing protein [Luteimonas sp BLCC-B24]|uniref:DMP19 family protein n=1 Tax=Luteimonas sp. BLCC-B24 TaxID=3025317 RepID=UPI00234DCB45|nr:DUF4375 domain-containing protein [Luteimonas sp. BLCC-B24]MDC7807413.1 DUF4375 domain-containing protein [Luteimonas sp. BLCC-B24]